MRNTSKSLALILTAAAIILALAACSVVKSPDADKKMVLMRSNMLAAAEVCFTADIRADYGERVFDFTVTYEGTAEDGTVTVIQPEIIAGITAHVKNGSVQLIWDGAALDTGAPAESINPAEMVPVLLEQWRGGYMDVLSLIKDGDTEFLTASSEITPGVRQTTVFDADTLLPVRGEISVDGAAVLTAVFKDSELR